MFNQESYDRHGEWYNQHFPTETDKVTYFKKAKELNADNVAVWLQSLFFKCIDPLLNKTNQRWLTVGDAYGFDAQYIISKGSNAVATDLNADFLSVAKSEGIVEEYAAENAERLSFKDNSFDFVLCKESYHHFPRPYAALYEMIRVAHTGIMIIEPQDPVSKMPLILFLNNILAKAPKLLNKVWKNRFSFEPVGNFVYKVSEREFEKFAAGLGLPLVAFKNLNPNFYFKGAENLKTNSKDTKFLKLKAKKKLLDILVSLKLIPGQVLSTIVFKRVPDQHIIDGLKADGYHLVYIPKNPYTNA